jgi:hypothetical protein
MMVLQAEHRKAQANTRLDVQPELEQGGEPFVRIMETAIAIEPSMAASEDVSHQEVSHVFHCMQCDLQVQMDIAVTSRNGSHEIDAGVVRVRLDPRITLEREG